MKQAAFCGRLGNSFLGSNSPLTRLTASDVTSASLDFINSSFSISLWFTNLGVSGLFPYRTFVVKGRQLAEAGYAIGIREDISVFYFGFNKGYYNIAIPGGYSAIYNRLTHLVMTYDLATTTLKLYLNKTQIYTNSAIPALSETSFLLGATSYKTLTVMGENEFTSRSILGAMHQLNFYNKALSASEIAFEYETEGCRPILGNLVEGFGFNQKNGNTVIGRNGMVLNVVGYTNAQLAANGTPQSGNTAWVNAYTLQPITS